MVIRKEIVRERGERDNQKKDTEKKPIVWTRREDLLVLRPERLTAALIVTDSLP